MDKVDITIEFCKEVIKICVNDMGFDRGSIIVAEQVLKFLEENEDT